MGANSQDEGRGVGWTGQHHSVSLQRIYALARQAVAAGSALYGLHPRAQACPFGKRA